MITYLFTCIILLHGLIHLMGFAKGFNYGFNSQITIGVSKIAGVFWLITAALFIAVAMLYLFKNAGWPYVAISSVVLSQILIVAVWKYAKYGTIANLIVLLLVLSKCVDSVFAI